MEDGGLNTAVIDNWQHKNGRMADFPPCLASSVFDLYKHYVPQMKSQIMGHALMDLANTILNKKVFGPIIENEQLWVCTKMECLHIPISLLQCLNIWRT